MIPAFDIFRKDSGGSLVWVEAVLTHEDAKIRIQELAISSPGEYVVFNQVTGSKHAVCTDAASASGQSNP